MRLQGGICSASLGSWSCPPLETKPNPVPLNHSKKSNEEGHKYDE